jgi:hypothetical protein
MDVTKNEKARNILPYHVQTSRVCLGISDRLQSDWRVALQVVVIQQASGDSSNSCTPRPLLHVNRLEAAHDIHVPAG